MTTKTFQGSKGGGATFKQTPDNLRSVDTFEGVLGLAIGPLWKPVNGLNSVKIDGTPLEDEAGLSNFNGNFIAVIGDGDPAKFPQKIDLKLGQGAAPNQVGLTLSNDNASAPGPWVTQTLANTNANFIDLRFVVQNLFHQTDKGIFENTLTIEIEMKPIGKSTWVNPVINNPTGSYNVNGIQDYGGLINILLPRSFYDEAGNWKPQTSTGYSITGKTSQPAAYELRLQVPNEGIYEDVGWDIRCRLVEQDSYEADPITDKRTVAWESIAAVYGNTMGEHEDWRGVAWMQVYGQASDQLTGVPEITSRWFTKIVSVPNLTVFNPLSRVYSGATWDGSWSKFYTNDPAWVIADAISDPLAGLSLIAPGSYLNRWDGLEASKWCSQLVSDGDGGLEPRYSLNLAITQPQKAEEFVRYLSGAVGGLAWDEGDGQWRLKMDKPDEPVDIFTLENIEGEFIYAHTDVDTRFNDITLAFKNKEMDFREDRVRVFNNESIAAIGRKPTTIVGVGCTGRQEALRRAKLRLESTTGETRIVNFTTNRRGRNVNQLDTILVADGDLGDSEKRTTGRIIDIASDRLSVTLRDSLRLELDIEYTFKFSSPNPLYDPETSVQPDNDDWRKPTIVQTRDITNTNSQRGFVKTIYFSEPLPEDVDERLSIAISATNLPTMPKLYRVMSISPADDGERMAISALEVNVAKWSLSDNVDNTATVFVDLRGAVSPPLPPLNGEVLSLVRVPIEQGSQVSLVASWIRPTGAFISGFRVRHTFNGGPWIVDSERQQNIDFELANPTPGLYVFEIVTLDRRGSSSTPLVASKLVTQEILDATQIKYAGSGRTLEEMEPLDPQATNGAPVGSNVAGVPAELVISRLFSAETILSDAVIDLNNAQDLIDTALVDIDEAQARADQIIADSILLVKSHLDQNLLADKRIDRISARTYFNGEKIGTVVRQEITERIEGDTAIVEDMSLLGAKSGDGLAWILDINTVKVSPTLSIGQRFSEIDSTITTVSATVAANYTTLSTAITTETSARVSAISTLTASLSTEASTRAAAITTVSTAISDEAGARASAVSTLTANLATTNSNLSAAITNYQSADTTETAARVAAFNSLTASLSTEVSDRTAAVSTLTTADATEASTRAAAVTTLTTNLASEASTRAAAITTVSTAISDEAGARSAAVSSLTASLATTNSNLAAAITDYQTADTTEASARAAAITTLTATVSGVSSTVSTHSSVITDLLGRTEAYWTVSATTPGTRADITIFADNAGAGVNITGDVSITGDLIVDGSVLTPKMADQSITIRAGVNQSGTLAGDNTVHDICSYTLVLPYDAMVKVSAFGSQNYFSTIPDFEAKITVDGTSVASASGGATVYQAIVALGQTIFLASGTYVINYSWRGGGSGIVLSSGNLQIDAAMK